MANGRDGDWLIDGYNLLPRWRLRVAGAAGTLAADRSALLHWLADRVAVPARATVAFDARDDSRAGVAKGAFQRTVFRGLPALFATGYRDADALLAELCQQHAAPRTLRVVSDDKAVRHVARRSGAGWMSCVAYLDWLDRGDREPSAPPRAESRPIASATEDRNRVPTATETAEWLRAFGSADPPPPAPPASPPPRIPPAKRTGQDCNDAALADFFRDMKQAEAGGFPDDGAPQPLPLRRRPRGV